MQQHEIGQLDENELNMISSYRKAANDMLQQIGQLEVQKARLLGQMGELEERAQKVLNDAKARLNVPPNAPCFITGEGKVMSVEQPPQH